MCWDDKPNVSYLRGGGASGELGALHNRSHRAVTTLTPRNGAPRTSEIHVSVGADDLRVFAEHGYEGAAGADHDLRAQTISLFITDMARRTTIGQGNGVTTCNAVTVTT
jgi:hypothetical protein